MKKERILVVDDQNIVQQGIKSILEAFGREDGHKIVGQALSVSEVEELLKSGLRPTIALVDGNFPNRGDGNKAAEIIRRLSPETKIIAFSTDPQDYGDEQWNKHMSGRELIVMLTNLQY